MFRVQHRSLSPSLAPPVRLLLPALALIATLPLLPAPLQASTLDGSADTDQSAGATAPLSATPQDAQNTDSQRIELQLLRQIAQDPQADAPLRALAVLLARSGRLAEARDALERAYALVPTDANLAMSIARLNGAIDGPDALRATLERFSRSAPDPYPFRIALVQHDFATGNKARAREALDALLDEDMAPDRNQAVRLLLARTLIDAGEPQAALYQVEAVLREAPERADALAFRAGLRLNALDLDGAQADIDRGLRAHPDNVSLLQIAARAARRAGDLPAAMGFLERASRASGHQPGLVLRTVALMDQLDEKAGAVILLETALAAHPDDVQLLTRLGRLHLSVQNWSAAEQAATALRQIGTPEALRLSEQLRVSVLRGRGQEDEAQNALANLAQSGSDIGAVATVVNDHLRRNDVEAALNYLDGLLRIAPDNPNLLLVRASVHELTDASDSAEQDLRRVTEIAPQSPAGYARLARHLTRAERYVQAEEALRAGLAQVPGNPTLQLSLSDVLLRRSDVDQAVGILEDLVRAYPDNLIVANNYVAVVTDFAEASPEQLARAAAVAGPLRDADNPRLRDTYGWLKHKQGDNATALRILDSVLAETPNDGWANYHMGLVLRALGRRDEALDHLRRALGTTDASFDKAPLVLELIAELEAP